MSESFAELFEQSRVEQRMRPGAIFHGRVEAIHDDVVVVHAGLKSEGLIPIEQFYGEDGELEIGVGDEVEVALDTVENGYGETRLSRERAKWMRVWEDMQAAYDDGSVIQGKITDRIKGGFVVDVRGLRAFLPVSLLDVSPVHDPSYLQGKALEFKIINLDQRHNNLVVSRRAVLTNADGSQQDIAERIKEGEIMDGVVKNLTEYGAFVDLGGIDGLLHITDMSWKRVRNPTEAVSVGQALKVKVLKHDRERNRISLGLKQMCEDPWSNLMQRYPQGARHAGSVTNIAEYGCFVELEEGVEGLVHITEMDWVKKNIHPSKLVQIGDKVEVEVLGVDQERRRISLGMKQCRPNPWQEFSAIYKKGTHVQGRLIAVTDFGIFINLAEYGIDGLVHISDLSWSEDADQALRGYDKRRGEELEAVVLNVDAERERISLGIKQLQPDPLIQWAEDHPKNSTASGKVIAIDSRVVRLELAEDVIGHIRHGDLGVGEEARDASTQVKVGDAIEAKVISIDRKKRSIQLSVRAHLIDEESRTVEEYARKEQESKPLVSKLGDLLREQLKLRG